MLVLLLYPCLLGFNCDCNFKFRYCNRPFYINGLLLFKFGKIDYFGKCQCFWCVALIFVQLIFAYGLLKKKPNFILIWILEEAVNLVVRLHSILKCYCLTLISIINISMSNFLYNFCEVEKNLLISEKVKSRFKYSAYGTLIIKCAWKNKAISCHLCPKMKGKKSCFLNHEPILTHLFKLC